MRSKEVTIFQLGTSGDSIQCVRSELVRLGIVVNVQQELSKKIPTGAVLFVFPDDQNNGSLSLYAQLNNRGVEQECMFFLCLNGTFEENRESAFVIAKTIFNFVMGITA